jgi:ubiquinone/menaquinone biosynthesis C-methylase UbiE
LALSLGDAYSATGTAWREGPERIYDRLADALVAASPVPLAGERVADVGAGTGAASRAIAREGGVPIALDLADGMLRVAQRSRPPAVVADGRRLPLANGSCAAVVAAFSYNHVSDPHVALAEAARVVGTGRAVLASAYALDDDHPVKAAVDTAVSEAGWMPEPWVQALKTYAAPHLATVAGALDAAARAGLSATAEAMEVPFPELTPADLVAWRLGMAQVAPFMAARREEVRQAITSRALDLLGPNPEPLVRHMIVLVGRT